MRRFFVLIKIVAFITLFGNLLPAKAQTTGAQKLAAFSQQVQMIQRSPYKNLTWRLTGPNNTSGRSTDS